MAAALAKWVDEDPAKLVRYALDAYETVRTDLEYLHAVQVIRYEDLIAHPDQIRRSLFAFLSLRDNDPQIALRDGNEDYKAHEGVDASLAERMTDWGYLPGGGVVSHRMICRHPLREVREISANQPKKEALVRTDA